MNLSLMITIVIVSVLQLSAKETLRDDLSCAKCYLTSDFSKTDDNIRWPKGYESFSEKFLSEILQQRVGIWESDLFDNLACYDWNGIKRLWVEITNDAVVSLYLENIAGEFIDCDNSGKFFFSDESIFVGESHSGLLFHYGIVDDCMYVLLSPNKYQIKLSLKRSKMRPARLVPLKYKKTHRYVGNELVEVKSGYCDTNLYSIISGFYSSKDISPVEVSHGVTQKFLSINRNGVMADIYLIDGKYCFMEREWPWCKFHLRQNFMGIPAVGDGRLTFANPPPYAADYEMLRARYAGLKGLTEIEKELYLWYSNSLFYAREKAKNWINEPNVVYTLTTNMVFNKDDMEIMRVWERLEADNELKEWYLKKIDGK